MVFHTGTSAYKTIYTIEKVTVALEMLQQYAVVPNLQHFIRVCAQVIYGIYTRVIIQKARRELSNMLVTSMRDFSISS